MHMHSRVPWSYHAPTVVPVFPLVASAIVPALGVVHQDAEEDNSKVYVYMLYYIPGKLYLDMELRKPIKKFDQPVPEKVTPSF